MFHISDIKRFTKCHKLYYLNKTKKESYFNFYRNDYNLIDIYKELFNIKDCFIGKTGDNPGLVLDNIDKYEYFINARFATSDLRIKVSLLHKLSDGYDLYIFKPMLPKELDLNSLFTIYDVLNKNNINIKNVYFITVNKEYILENTINYNKAIYITNKFVGVDIIDLILDTKYDYETVIKEMKDYVSDDNDINRNCTSCIYFEECFNDKFPDDSILHLVSSKYKFDMFNDGIYQLKNVDINKIDGTSLQYAQIMASRNNGFFIDKIKLKQFIDSFKSNTISFIDFEWDCFLFPKYKGMNCFGLLPFEFCLYVKNGENIDNYCYVGKGDCREEFIVNLIDKLPKEGPIVAYNSFSAEVLRIKELANQFPKYKNKLDDIAKRFVDLAQVFTKGYIYDNKYKGQLSLKNIVSIISDISYDDLKIKDGLDAVYNFRIYEETNDEDIKNNLIKYCNQDAYSLLKIYYYLISLL